MNTIILTSEDARYLSRDRSSYMPRWRFIVNNYDIMPSTGLGHTVLQKFAKESMDSMLFSALSSFQLQIRGKYFTINCDSGIHQIIGKLATNGGCSLAQNPKLFCLQDQVSTWKWETQTQLHRLSISHHIRLSLFAHIKPMTIQDRRDADVQNVWRTMFQGEAQCDHSPKTTISFDRWGEGIHTKWQTKKENLKAEIAGESHVGKNYIIIFIEILKFLSMP